MLACEEQKTVEVYFPWSCDTTPRAAPSPPAASPSPRPTCRETKQDAPAPLNCVHCIVKLPSFWIVRCNIPYHAPRIEGSLQRDSRDHEVLHQVRSPLPLLPAVWMSWHTAAAQLSQLVVASCATGLPRAFCADAPSDSAASCPSQCEFLAPEVAQGALHCAFAHASDYHELRALI